MLDQIAYGKKSLFWFTVSGNIVHRGGGAHIARGDILAGTEADGHMVWVPRKHRGKNAHLNVFLLGMQPRTHHHGMVLPTFRLNIPASVNFYLETPSQSCPEIYRQGNSRSCPDPLSRVQAHPWRAQLVPEQMLCSR